MSFTFINQMEENVGLTLQYPYHMDYSKCIMEHPANTLMPTALISGSFQQVLRYAYREPFAFYLTDTDKDFYSRQELELISRVITVEQQNIANGKELLDLELDDDTINLILQYKNQNKLTFEQAITKILEDIIAIHKQ